MNQFKQALEAEILLEAQQLKQSQAVVDAAPPGRLFIRQRKHRVSHYQITKEKTDAGWRSRWRNISNDPAAIYSLSEKALAEKTIRICRSNLLVLERTYEAFQSPDVSHLTQMLPPKYQDALRLRRKQQILDWMTAPYAKAPFDPGRHIHETAYGGLVRSKSEVIIANALFSYGIPFHYEERFANVSEQGGFYYPDFVILLPDGTKLIWEHLGLLTDLSYCISNAQKLHAYQQNQVFIGKNLILTQDDRSGNCNSAFIYHIIQEYILPFFQEIDLDPSDVKTALAPHRSRFH